MPRKPDLSWQMKQTIWDLAAKLGEEELQAIQTSLDRIREKDELKEDVPDTRTIKRIIGELQSLPIPVLKSLPEHIWLLRRDYKEIAQPKEQAPTKSEPDELVVPLLMQRTKEHQDRLLKLVRDWWKVLEVPSPDSALRQLEVGTIRATISLYSEVSGVREVRSWWNRELEVREEGGVLRVVRAEWWPGEEGQELLFRAAFFPPPGAHPLPEEFWSYYEDARGSLRQMFTEGVRLFNELKAELKSRTPLPVVAGYSKTGLWPYFLEWACNEAWSQYRGVRKLDDYKLQPGPDGTILLNLAAVPLGCGSQEEMEKARQVHTDLVGWLAGRLKPVQELHDQAKGLLGEAKKVLLQVAERGMFGGKCKVCP